MALDLQTRPKLARWVLIISLGLNVAIIGLVIGVLTVGPHDRRGPPLPGLTNFSVLPEPYRSNLAREMRRGRDDWSRRRDDLRLQREAMAAVLTADPFDIAAFEDILTREQSLLQEITQRGTALLVLQIEQMSQSERAAYADALLEARGRPPHSKRPH